MSMSRRDFVKQAAVWNLGERGDINKIALLDAIGSDYVAVYYQTFRVPA